MSGGGRWQLDAWARRGDRGRLLAGGAPARLVRLTDAGAAALDALLGEAPGAVDGSAAEPLADEAARALATRLRDAGLIHPLAPPGERLVSCAPNRGSSDQPSARLTTVIPVRDGGEGLAALVRAARAWGEVIVVDDRSRDGSAARARAAGARVIANDGPPGPAAARNAGLRAAGTDLVAFLDADCLAGTAPSAAAIEPVGFEDGLENENWAPRLAALLADDPGLALAAPRVRSAPGAGAIALYERLCSPLDMGPSPALVGPGRRLGYVPATALVARRAALLALGGFDERLRFGEDVDLAWRLARAGWRVRYAPEAEALHRPRATAPALARQRFEYGRSAAALDRLHPGEAAPLRLDHLGAATWLAATVAGWRRRSLAAGLAGAAAAATASSAWVAFRGGVARATEAPQGGGGARAGRPATRTANRGALAGVAARGQLQTARQLCRALVRDWLPLTAAASLASPRARRAAALAAAVDLAATLRATERARGVVVSFARYPDQRHHNSPRAAVEVAAAGLALRLVDHAAYAAGLWAGATRARSPRALLPRMAGPGGRATDK